MIEGTKQLNEFPATLSVSGTDLIYSASGYTGVEQRTTVNQLQSFIQAPIAQGALTDAGTLTGTETVPLGRSGLFQSTLTRIAQFAQSLTLSGFQTNTGAAANQGASLSGWDNGTIASFFTNHVSKQVLTVAALRAVDPTLYTLCSTLGHTSAGDGGSMNFVYIATTTPPADNNGTYISALGGLGYWLGLFAGEVTLLQFGGVAGNITLPDLADPTVAEPTLPIVNDSGPALQAAIAFCTAAYPTRLRIPAGYYMSSYAPGQITRPVRITGDGWRMSIIQFIASVTGPIFAPTDVGFEGNSADYITDGNKPITTIKSAYAGFELLDISIYGDRNSALQEGVIFKGDCDHASIRNVMLMHINGRSIAGGDTSPLTNQRGCVRESEFWHIKTRNCGQAGVWDIDFTLSESTGGDGNNIVNFWGCESIFPYGGSLRIRDDRTDTVGPVNYVINFHGCTAHGRFAADTYNANELVLLQGAVTSCKIEFYLGYCMTPNIWAFRQIANATNGATPTNNKILLTYGTIRKGYSIEAGSVSLLEIINPFTYQETGQVFPAALNATVACEGNQPFQKLSTAVIFNGVTPVSIGTGSALPGITTLLPVMSASNGASGTGDGDSTNVMLYGIQCVLSRTGSVAAGADTYTLTPLSASAVTVAAGQYLSKHIVQLASYTSMRGRFLYTPRSGYGENAEFYLVDNQKLIMFDAGGGVYHTLSASGTGHFKLQSPDAAGNLTTILDVLGGPSIPAGSPPIPTWGLFPVAGSGYASLNLLQMGPWRLWVDAFNRMRIRGVQPTSDFSGSVFQTNRNGATGTEPTGTDLGGVAATATGEDWFDTNYQQKKTWNGTAWKTGNAPLYQDGVQHPITYAVQAAAETTLGSTWSLGGNQIGPQGRMEVELLASATLNNSNVKTLRLYVGSVVIWTGTLIGDLSFPIKVIFQNRNATGSQIVTQASITTTGPSGNAVVTTAIDTTTVQICKVTGQLSTAGDGIALECISVKWFNP